MGPGLFIKAVMQGSFSLMVFGWAQIVMDVQPLIAIVTGEGNLHGFSHTYFGATLIAIASAITGKFISEFGLKIIGIYRQSGIKKIKWLVVFVSSFIGTYSHVALDSIMHIDVEPLYPLSQINVLYGFMSVSSLHQLCLYSGAVGTLIYFSMQYWIKICEN